jgi:hypothetical protein
MSKYNLIDIYEQYQIGSGWTTDFDYDGMLKTGLGTSIDTPIEVLKKMSDDFEDVNYHRENSHLQYAIDAIEIGDMKEAESRLNDFHAEIKQTIKDQGMDIEPTLGKFMASKMEEEMAVFSSEEDEDKYIEKMTKKTLEKEKAAKKEKEVEEVTSREGSRIEGLLSIPLKAKFLEAFQDLYFDLVEEDPFAAEDVIDHLGIEMLKHLDAVQAQGDKLAGVNTDADFEREQRAQLDMREEDSIEEGIPTSDITKALKDDAKATDSEIKQYMASVKKAGDKFDDVDDYVEDFKNYVADKSLQEHFGRFMKDYQ